MEKPVQRGVVNLTARGSEPCINQAVLMSGFILNDMQITSTDESTAAETLPAGTFREK